MPQTQANETIQHPAPHAGRVSKWALYAVLLVPPLAWFAQLNVLYGLAGQACFPRDEPRLTSPAGFGWLPPVLIVLNVIGLALALGGMYLAWRNWRKTGAEASGGHRKLVEAGEGRTRFLSVCGFWGGSWFVIAILFDTIAAIMVPLCGG